LLVGEIDLFLVKPPVSAPAHAINISNGADLVDCIENVKIANGANFCQVDKIKAANHEIDIITDGYHMWNGAAPILINSADISIGIIRWVGVVESVHSDSDLISNILDPNA